MRLTKKENGKYVYDDIYYGEHIEKLGQLEDIEEELGIGLTTLFKALKSDYLYFINFEKTGFGKIMKIDYWDYDFNFYHEDNSIYVHCEGTYYFKDYGVTWSLTEKELL